MLLSFDLFEHGSVTSQGLAVGRLVALAAVPSSDVGFGDTNSRSGTAVSDKPIPLGVPSERHPFGMIRVFEGGHASGKAFAA